MTPAPQPLKVFSQQPGFIDKEGASEELGKIEEIISNPKSREQSQSSAIRNNTNAASRDGRVNSNHENAEEEMMQSRYIENEEGERDEEYKTIDHSDPNYNESSSCKYNYAFLMPIKSI